MCIRDSPMPHCQPFARTGPMSHNRRSLAPVANLVLLLATSCACSPGRTAPPADPSPASPPPHADLILTNARVYTLAWGEPAADGAPAANAPVSYTHLTLPTS